MTSMSEYKRRERQRRAAIGERRVELYLTEAEYMGLQTACRLRNVGGKAYQMAEYLALLRINDQAALDAQLAALKPCPRCGKALPEGCAGDFKGEATCWLTRDFRVLNLTDMRVIQLTKPVDSPAVTKRPTSICDHCFERYCGNCLHADNPAGGNK
ncbi:hypothetical protein [Rahnella contaminans]|uniref:hypothetical protein n=1 Tax=Rahnella contaminans TaxID=2703882 RepID=UPI003C3095E1